jgi:outer membrane receptor protein involved in Fe transport
LYCLRPAPLGLAAAVVYAHGENLDADEPMRRIPSGGTPGWNVLNLRGSRDAGPVRLRVGLENLFDEAYRTHGSGIDGVGRAAWASVEAGF